MKTDNEKNLSILGHLDELRRRIVRCALAVVIASIVAFIFSDHIFHILTLPASHIAAVKLVYINMTEMLEVYMVVCISAGIAIAMPYLVYQVLMFIFPALTPKERKYILLMIPWTFLMFIAGVVFAYYVPLPSVVKFFLTFGSNIAAPEIRIGSYITVVTRIMLVSGAVFEMPVISTFLARIGIISSSWLASKRKIVIVLAFILGGVLTSPADIVDQIMIAAVLVTLYEVSILLAKLVQKKSANVISLQMETGNGIDART